MHVYATTLDAINNRNVEVRVPEWYDPTIPAFFRESGIGPFFDSAFMDPNAVSIAMFSTRFIVDMCDKDIPFSIVHDAEVEAVLRMLREYIKDIEPAAVNNKEAARTLASCTKTFDRIFRSKTDKDFFFKVKNKPLAQCSFSEMIDFFDTTRKNITRGAQ